MPEYNPPIDEYYCEVEVVELMDKEVYKMMGRGGAYFKILTEQCKAKYIWWNKDKKVIEIWGSYGCLGKAYNRLINKKKEILKHRIVCENPNKRERTYEEEDHNKRVFIN